MLQVTHLRTPDYKTKTWKNGHGKSREIAIDDHSPFRWRLSWAAIPSTGPFSLFPDYDRTLILINGGPLTLNHEGRKPKPVPLWGNVTFKGDWNTIAEVDSAAEDFNVFALRGSAKARVYPSFLSKGEDLQFPLGGQEHFLFCAEGEVEVLEQNLQKSFTLSDRQTLRISRDTGGEYLNLRARGSSAKAVCLWIVIHLSPIRPKAK